MLQIKTLLKILLGFFAFVFFLFHAHKVGRNDFGSFFFVFSRYRTKVYFLKKNNPDLLKTYKAYFKSADDGNKFYLIKAFYLLGLFDSELCEMSLDYAKKVDNFDFKYWIALDLTYIVFRNPDALFPTYYKQRRELFADIAKRVEYERPAMSNSPNANKVCIIVFTLNGKLSNSMQRITTMIANGLLSANQNNIISVVVSDAFALSKEEKPFSSLFPLSYSEQYSKDINELFSDKISVFYPPVLSVKDRMIWLINKIVELNPSIVLDVTDETSPISYYYSKYYPTIYLPIRGVFSSSFFTTIINPTIVSEQNESLDSKRLVTFDFPEYVPPKGPTFFRKDFSLCEDDFVIVSIGSGYGFDVDFYTNICQLLHKHPKMKWVLVGFPVPKHLKSSFRSLFHQGRIIEHGYEQNLVSFCEICDVCLRPNWVGGSGGTAMAAMAKLPIVLTTYNSDPLRWLGKDYTSLTDYHELANEIEKLYLDKDYYKYRSEETFDKIKFAMESDSSWKQLDTILKSQIEDWWS